MKAFIHTLGCKVNQYESEAMMELLRGHGYAPAESEADAGVVVINSCTVTAASDQKMRKLLRRCRRNNPGAVLVLTGCMPQAFPEAAAALTDADVILGNSCRSLLPGAVEEFLNTGARVVRITPHQAGDGFEALSVSAFHGRTRAFLKIEDGCDRFCSYCIIPYARGRVRSKPLAQVKQEAQGLAAAGYQEIVLTGINLSAYGQDLGLHLCDAVDAVCETGVSRVRLGSLEPEQMEEAVVKRLSRQQKLCPQFHLSLQSGCDATLKRMNRHYTAAEYLEIAERLRRHFENAAITTDIMVGFAGETDEEFEESLTFAQRAAFARVHVFAYSRRPGTAADKLPGQLANAVKEERSRRMIELTSKTRKEFLATQVGRTEPVLFESRCDSGRYEGYTPNYTTVRVTSETPLFGRILPVLIESAEDDCCFGRLTEI